MTEILVGLVLVVLALNVWLLHGRVVTLEQHALSMGEGVKALLHQEIDPDFLDDPFIVSRYP